MKKKLLALSPAACMALSLAGCGSNPAIDPSDDGAGNTTDAHPFNIGICQLVQHDALDAATRGFKDAVEEALGAENVNWNEQNAAGDSATCTTICGSFVSEGGI